MSSGGSRLNSLKTTSQNTYYLFPGISKLFAFCYSNLFIFLFFLPCLRCWSKCKWSNSFLRCTPTVRSSSQERGRGGGGRCCAMWRFRLLASVKVFSHCRHWYFVLSCTEAMWRLTSLARVKVLTSSPSPPGTYSNVYPCVRGRLPASPFPARQRALSVFEHTLQYTRLRLNSSRGFVFLQALHRFKQKHFVDLSSTFHRPFVDLSSTT